MSEGQASTTVESRTGPEGSFSYIGTIFIPLTFLAGVYDMNFRHLPELEWQWGSAIFWVVSAAIPGGMVGDGSERLDARPDEV